MAVDLGGIAVSHVVLPGRVRTAFKRARIFTLGQVDSMSDTDLTALHGIGELTVRYLRQTLDAVRLAS